MMIRRLGEWFAAVLAASCVLVSPYVELPWLLAIIVILISIILYLIKATKNISLAIIVLAVLYGLSIIPILIFACSLAIFTAGELAYRWSEKSPYQYGYYVFSASIGAALVILYFSQATVILRQSMILPVLFGVVVAALLKAILQEREDALVLEAVGIAMTMLLIQDLDYQADPTLIAIAVIIAFGFGYFSYKLRTADLSGLFSGALIGIILIIFSDVRWFFIMLAFFIIGSACTRYKFDLKEKLGVEQTHGGARGYKNVFANGIVSASAAVLYGITGNAAFAAMFVGSVATAAADTVASEIGVTGGEPYLITSFRRVKAGTNGGVTVTGEMTALVTSAIIGLIAYLLGVVSPTVAVVCMLAGFIGTNLDSLVGAVIENRGVIGNAGTNVIATLGGGLFALAVVLAAGML